MTVSGQLGQPLSKFLFAAINQAEHGTSWSIGHLRDLLCRVTLDDIEVNRFAFFGLQLFERGFEILGCDVVARRGFGVAVRGLVEGFVDDEMVPSIVVDVKVADRGEQEGAGDPVAFAPVDTQPGFLDEILGVGFVVGQRQGVAVAGVKEGFQVGLVTGSQFRIYR